MRRIAERVSYRYNAGVSYLGKFVPEAIDSLQLYGRSGLFQLLAEIFHLRVDEVQRVSLVDIVAPDGFEQGLA